MEDIRRIPDPITGKYYYPQTHYLAVVDLDNHIKELMNQNDITITPEAQAILDDIEKEDTNGK